MYLQTDLGLQRSAATSGATGLVALTPRLQLPGFVMSFSRNEEIFGEEEPADFIYSLVSGAVRTTRLLADGRRQIGAFLLPGDVFGRERGAVHRFSAEALGDCKIALVRRPALERAAERDSAVACELWRLTAAELERLDDQLLLLSRKGAAERVAAFLLELAQRQGGGETIELPMSRADIGDHLGLTIETVSRTLSQFEREAIIALPSTRRVRLLDPTALCRV